MERDQRRENNILATEVNFSRWMFEVFLYIIYLLYEIPNCNNGLWYDSTLPSINRNTIARILMFSSGPWRHKIDRLKEAHPTRKDTSWIKEKSSLWCFRHVNPQFVHVWENISLLKKHPPPTSHLISAAIQSEIEKICFIFLFSSIHICI